MEQSTGGQRFNSALVADIEKKSTFNIEINIWKGNSTEKKRQ
jgi:hypothetical protein